MDHGQRNVDEIPFTKIWVFCAVFRDQTTCENVQDGRAEGKSNQREKNQQNL